MRGRVVAAYALAAGHVDGGMNGVAHLDAPACRLVHHLDGMRDQALLGLLGIEHRHDNAVFGQNARIADLAALLGVERRGVQHHAALLARFQHVYLLAVLHDRQHARIRPSLFV